MQAVRWIIGLMSHAQTACVRRGGRTAVAVIAAAWVLTAASTVEATQRTLVADLRGAQEVPPVSTGAYGAGRFVVDTTAKTVTYRISFHGLSSAETMAHIHGAAGPGVNAGVRHNLGVGNPKTGVWNYNAADEADILAGRMYVNIHSVNFPGGEIRGQIADFAMFMDGEQENPVIATPAQGWGTFTIDTCANELRYYISHMGLVAPETAAHIHGLSLPGTNSGVLHNLGVGMVKTGTWTYPQAIEEAILSGMTYVNVHSAVNPGGEIRGQIVRTLVPIDGLQEVPATPSAGSGNMFVAFDTTAHQLGYYVRSGGLLAADTAAHIHGFSPPGVNSGVLHNLGVGDPKKGSWTYGAANEANVMNGLTYINIHSAAFPGGEIRGQIVPALAIDCVILGDLNGDGIVDFADLLILLSAWGPCAGCPADLNGDDLVDFSDLLILLGEWT